jgi:hypothetical protein
MGLVEYAREGQKTSTWVGEKSFLWPRNFHVIEHDLNFVQLILLQRGAFEEDGSLCRGAGERGLRFLMVKGW